MCVDAIPNTPLQLTRGSAEPDPAPRFAGAVVDSRRKQSNQPSLLVCH
jgi:hypothetical protein